MRGDVVVGSVSALRLAGITLLLLAWLPGAWLVTRLDPWWVAGLVAGLPAACCFALAYRRSGAAGNLVGVGLALATPLVWLGMLILLIGGADLS